MKKNSYYFSLLSEVEQGQFRENYKNNRGLDRFLQFESSSFESFVRKSFWWDETPTDQGYDYWYQISKRPEPTDKEPQTMVVSFVPSLDDVKKALGMPRFKKYSFKGETYVLTPENVLELIIEVQKIKE